MDLFTSFGEQALEYIQLDPGHIKLWRGNARCRELLTAKNCGDLIQSIAREGGNKVPVIVRRIPGDRLYFELIAGTRRHFAVSYLQQRDHPHIQLLAQVMQLSDQEAFRISDVENSARADVSTVARARNYAWALDEFYDGKQVSLAEALDRSTSWVSKMLAIAKLPDEVLNAFRSPADLDFRPAYKLAVAFADPEQQPAILTRAQQLANEQITRADLDPIPAPEVVSRLLDAKRSRAGTAVRVWSKPSGNPYFTLKKRDAEGMHIIVHADVAASEWHLTTAFKECLDMRRGSERDG